MNVLSVEYHRNGVSGAGFFVVQFTAEGRRLVGVVWDNERGCEAVLDVDSLDTPLRGSDVWGSQLQRAIAAAACDGSAFVHITQEDA